MKKENASEKNEVNTNAEIDHEEILSEFFGQSDSSLKAVAVGASVLVVATVAFFLIAASIGYLIGPPEEFRPMEPSGHPALYEFIRHALWGASVIFKGVAYLIIALLASLLAFVASRDVGIAALRFSRKHSKKRERDRTGKAD